MATLTINTQLLNQSPFYQDNLSKLIRVFSDTFLEKWAYPAYFKLENLNLNFQHGKTRKELIARLIYSFPENEGCMDTAVALKENAKDIPGFINCSVERNLLIIQISNPNQYLEK